MKKYRYLRGTLFDIERGVTSRNSGADEAISEAMDATVPTIERGGSTKPELKRAATALMTGSGRDTKPELKRTATAPGSTKPELKRAAIAAAEPHLQEAIQEFFTRKVIFEDGLVKFGPKPNELEHGEDQIMHKIEEEYRKTRKNDFIIINTFFKKVISSVIVDNPEDTQEVDKILFLMDYFDKLRTTSFEGDYFSTAMIYMPKRTIKDDQPRRTKKVSLVLDLKKDIDRRLWYLVDGKKSFYVCEDDLKIKEVLLIEEDAPAPNIQGDQESLPFVSNLFLMKNLQHGQILFRIHNEKCYSIITKNYEFAYRENKWRYINYRYLTFMFEKYISEEPASNPKAVISSFLYYIFYCSRNSVSSIILINRREEIEAEKFIIPLPRFLTESSISITDRTRENQIKRIISSDGVTIFNNKGQLLHYGCIVKLAPEKDDSPTVQRDQEDQESKKKQLSGTGEKATKLLASLGLAIKISEDGTIKMFDDNEKVMI